MFYIVGLGNHTAQYEQTRHNVGWMMLDAFIDTHALPQPIASAHYAGMISRGVLDGHEVTLLYPHTYMNKSGSAVRKLVAKHDAARLIVIYDDVDLPLGQIKISFGRGDGGHNGIGSIIAALGTKDFIRIRVGIAKRHFFTGSAKRPSRGKLPAHVLGKFSPKEMKEVVAVSQTVCAALDTIIADGVEQAMNQYNAQ